MKTLSIMFQGTGSGVGKSIVTAGFFCRLLADRGVKVAPFKSQNMALNSGVVGEGLEMGRAQILQAEAAYVTADVRMNPILLKPQGNSVSQLVRMGKVSGVHSARDYYQLMVENFEIVKKTAYDDLASEYDVIVLEGGAGSPAEINLHKTDIVNMRMADYAQSNVYIIGDIDRGGVFAWMKGTYDLVEDNRRELIKGFIINKFRGDVTLLQPGIDMFNDHVPVPVVGTLPYLRLTLEEEDSQDIVSDKIIEQNITVGVIRLPRISNFFSDFAPLKSNEKINLLYIDRPETLQLCDVIIIPGSKSTALDMRYMQERGFDKAINKANKPIVAICGGFQMLGNSIKDPNKLESDITDINGLGLFEMSTTIESEKRLVKRDYEGEGALSGINVSGYEMHMGSTQINSNNLKQLVSQKDICVYDPNKNVLGTYLHGIFETGEVTQKLFNLLGFELDADNYTNEKDKQLNLVAKTIEESCDVDRMLEGLGL